jgi:hypothetical protein
MRQLLSLATISIVLFLAAAPAHAGMLALGFQGAFLINIEGTPADPPIPFGNVNIQADFDTTTGTTLQQGVVTYAVTSVVLTGGGTSVTVTDPSDYSVTLVDATNTAIPGLYYPLLDNNSGTSLLNEIGPAYTTATPAFSAADPTPTVFSGYSGSQSFGNVLTFSTAAGPLTLEYQLITFDNSGGIGASINSVPEPSSLALCGISGSIGLVIAWRRRRRAARA